MKDPPLADRSMVARFHRPDYIEYVSRLSQEGQGYLDYGDTPAYPGVYEAALYAVGGTVEAVRMVMSGEVEHGFNPIGGLHHATPSSAGGFCVFNDVGVALKLLEEEYRLSRIAYVDIDAHHGDGVYYAFANDPRIYIVDIHEDGRYLYPGTGHAHERGLGPAEGTKLNLPLPPNADDSDFKKAMDKGLQFIAEIEPEFILLQCGADGLRGDPLTHLEYSAEAHRYAAAKLHRLAHRYARGRIVAVGGGGYNMENVARAWMVVLRELVAVRGEE